jgi:ketosteroid isomerase-like protein
MRRSLAHSGSARQTDGIDPQAVGQFIERWFAAVAARDADALVRMTNPDVIIRPFLARRTVDAVTYHGHDGVRDWIGSLDGDLVITLDLIAIEATSPSSAIVESEVYFETGGSRTGGLTFSFWRFELGKLSEAVGYSTKEDALDGERRSFS